MEIRFVDAFRKENVSWKAIHQTAEKAMELYQSEYPFATKRFRSDGRDIFAEIVHKTGELSLLNLATNQTAFHKVVSPALYENLEFADDRTVIRWWPLGKKRWIVLDPERSFGHPIVYKEGVPTATLAAAVRAKKSIERVARWYEVDRQSVSDAVEYEEHLAA